MFVVNPGPEKHTMPSIGHALMSSIVAGIFSSAVPREPC